MTQSYTEKERDENFMSLALIEARLAAEDGNYPVGAVLTLNGNFFDKGHNSLFTDKRWTAHAEHNLISRNSAHLLSTFRDAESYNLCLYTTLEPCLMCLGISVMHRVSRIVIACPDPHGGAIQANPKDLGIFYQNHWPQIEMGPFRDEVCQMIIQFLKTEKFSAWKTMLTEWETMRDSWR